MCRTFLVQCDLHYKHNPAAFVSGDDKIAFLVSHLTGRAAAWAMAEWARDSPICRSYSAFYDTMSRVFDQTSISREATRTLMQIKQYSYPVIDYAITFRTAASDSGWNNPALIDAFMNGLSDPIKQGSLTFFRATFKKENKSGATFTPLFFSFFCSVYI